MATRAVWAPFHPQPYRKGPTPASVRKAAELGRPLDIDVRACRDAHGRRGRGRLVGAHNRIPGTEGFRYTKESVKHGIPAFKVGLLCGRPIDALTLDVVLSLRTKAGDRYWAVGDLIAVAGACDAKLEFEPKVTLTVEQLRNLRTACIRAYGEDQWKRMVWVKKLTNIFGTPVPWRALLRDAWTLGFRTIALRVRTDKRGRALPVTNYRL